MTNIVFVHPAFREYRRGLFSLLDQRLSARFIFVEDYDDNMSLLPESGLRRWEVMRAGGFLFYSKGAAWPLIARIFKRDYTHWIASGLNHFTTHVAFLLVKLLGKKFILFAEDWWLADNFKTRLALPYMKCIARYANAVVVAGSRSKKFFEQLGTSPQRIFVGYNSIEPDIFLRSRNIKRASAARIVSVPPYKGITFLYLGRVVRYKGLDILLRSFVNLENEKKPVRLVVVGDGPFKKECINLARSLDIQNIIFKDSVTHQDVVYYFSLADIFVLPARFMFSENVVGEAWGFVVNEALHCGVPVITTKAVASAQDLIVSGKNGFVVDSENIEEMTKAMRLFVDDRDLCKRMKSFIVRNSLIATPDNQYSAFLKAIQNA